MTNLAVVILPRPEPMTILKNFVKTSWKVNDQPFKKLRSYLGWRALIYGSFGFFHHNNAHLLTQTCLYANFWINMAWFYTPFHLIHQTLLSATLIFLDEEAQRENIFVHVGKIMKKTTEVLSGTTKDKQVFLSME